MSQAARMPAGSEASPLTHLALARLASELRVELRQERSERLRLQGTVGRLSNHLHSLTIEVRELRDELATRRQQIETVGALKVAYRRACSICQEAGACEHREPDVEIAILRASGWKA